jgi:hypothetical protein
VRLIQSKLIPKSSRIQKNSLVRKKNRTGLRSSKRHCQRQLLSKQNARGQLVVLSSGVCVFWFEIAAPLAILPEELADRDFEGVGQLHECGQSKVLLASMQAAKSVCYFIRSWDTFAHCSRWSAAMNPLAFLSRLNQKSVVQALSLYSIFGCLESTHTSHTLLTPNS